MPGTEIAERLREEKEIEKQRSAAVAEQRMELKRLENERRQAELIAKAEECRKQAEERRKQKEVEREIQTQAAFHAQPVHRARAETADSGVVPPPPSTANDHRNALPDAVVNAKRRRHGWKTVAIIGVALTVLYFLFAPRFSWLPNTHLPDLRNKGLRDKLQECESFSVVNADVYYEGALSSNIVIFDLLEGGSTGARRIDPIHLFLEFASKLNLDGVDRVILARSGRKKFQIAASDLRPLASSYGNGGRLWAFNHLPEAVRTPDGDRPYAEWTGGWLGVLQKQTEDLNEFIKAWTGQ